MTIQTTEGFGLHLILDGYGGPKEKLADSNLIREVLSQLPSLLQMQKIADPLVIWYGGGDNPEDCGVSGFVLIAESHIAIHTFSQKEFLTADVYSCKTFDIDKTVEFFKKAFELKELETHVIKRGLKFPRTSKRKTSTQLPIIPGFPPN